MFAYLGLFGYFAGGALMYGTRPIAMRRGLMLTSAVILIVLIGLRWRIGTDWGVYELLLQSAALAGTGYANVTSEPGYNLLNAIAFNLGWGLWFPNVICAMIFTYGLLAFAREQPNPWLALVVATPYLIIGVAMGYTRQSAAVGFIMIALVQFSRGKSFNVFLCVGLASMFHISAIIMAPVFALASARRAVVTGIIFVLFGFLLYFAFSERIEGRISEYSTILYAATGAVPRLVMDVIAAVVFLPWRRRFAASPDEVRLWTMISLMSFLALTMVFFIASTTIVDRLGIFLVPLQMFVMSRVPFVFSHGNRANMALLIGIILYSLAAETVWLYFGVEAKWYWIPYKNFLWETWFASGPG